MAKAGLESMLTGVLGGAGQPVSPADIPNLSRSVMGFPSTELGSSPIPGMSMPGVINEKGALPQSDPTNPKDIVVNGKPDRKANPLGDIADMVLVATGHKPIYRPRLEDMRMKDAMEGFADDPLGAIKRVAKRDPAKAWEMYNTYQDNLRGDEAVAGAREARTEKSRGVIASMLGVATPENYDKMLPRMQQYAQAHGIDASELPEQYDPDAINMWRAGGMSVDNQEDNARDTAYKDEMMNYRRSNLAERTGYHRDTIASQRDRSAATVTEQNRHNRAMEARGPSGKPQEKTVQIKDSRGNVRILTVSADGQLAKQDLPDGSRIRFRIQDGKFIPYQRDPAK